MLQCFKVLVLFGSRVKILINFRICSAKYTCSFQCQKQISWHLKPLGFGSFITQQCVTDIYLSYQILKMDTSMVLKQFGTDA